MKPSKLCLISFGSCQIANPSDYDCGRVRAEHGCREYKGMESALVCVHSFLHCNMSRAIDWCALKLDALTD